MSDIPLPGGGTLKLWDSVYAPQQIEAAIGKGPIIQNGTWWLWDVTTMTYQDTGIALASGLGPGSVTTPMLADLAVTTPKLADGSVTWPKLSDEARPNRTQILDNAYWATPDAIVDQRGGLIVPQGAAYYSAPDTTSVGLTDKAYTAAVYNTYWVTILMGATTYYVPRTSAVRGYTADGPVTYCIDRWCFNLLIVTLTANGLQLQNTRPSLPGYISQKIEFSRIPDGDTVTFSVLANDNLYTTTFVISQTMSAHRADFDALALECSPDNGYYWITIYNQADNVTVTAAKLEKGPNQTLAHESAGVDLK